MKQNYIVVLTARSLRVMHLFVTESRAHLPPAVSAARAIGLRTPFKLLVLLGATLWLPHPTLALAQDQADGLAGSNAPALNPDSSAKKPKSHGGATESARDTGLPAALARGILEEEGNLNLRAAMKNYQAVVAEFDEQRRFAATALFRLGECYRKLGQTNEARAQYQRVISEFPDQTELASRCQPLVPLAVPAAGVGQPDPELERIKALCEQSPDLINAPGKDGESPLEAAAAKGQIEIVRFLLDHGAAVDSLKEPELTPLHYAAGNGRLDVVELLLRRGARVDAVTESGVTPLHIAALKGYLRVAKALLDSGAPANAALRADVGRKEPGLQYSGALGATPLDLAVDSGQTAIVELLLAHHAEVNNRYGSGQTPLLVAARGGQGALVEILLRRGASVSAKDNAGDSPLHLAAKGGFVAEIKALAQAKAEVNARNTAGETPLVVALRNAQPDAAEALLTLGADPNLGDKQSSRPLHFAVHLDTTNIMDSLRRRAADLNACNTSGQTPLHWAVVLRRLDMVQALLSAGADPNRPDAQDRTPLDLAKAKQAEPPVHPVRSTEADPAEIVAALRQAGALDSIPHLDRISVIRGQYSETIFRRGTNDWNHFTLLDLIANWYGLASTSQGNWARNEHSPNSFLSSVASRPYNRYPDFSRITIRRPSGETGQWTLTTVVLTEAFTSRDCAGALPLQWGDAVLVPEADHPVNEIWRGLSAAVLETLTKCMTRQVEIVVKGQTNQVAMTLDVVFGNDGNPVQIGAYVPFMLRPALLRSNLILASSDLTRVKVTRKDPATGRTLEWVLDCSDSTTPPDLWLMDGDRIEVPEK